MARRVQPDLHVLATGEVEHHRPVIGHRRADQEIARRNNAPWLGPDGPRELHVRAYRPPPPGSQIDVGDGLPSNGRRAAPSDVPARQARQRRDRAIKRRSKGRGEPLVVWDKPAVTAHSRRVAADERLDEALQPAWFRYDIDVGEDDDLIVKRKPVERRKEIV